MIKAEEARALAGPSAKQILEKVSTQIQEAAKSNKHEIKLRDEFWARGGYDKTDLYKECVSELEKLGYKVAYFFVTNQFVDAGVTISWEA